MIILELLFFRKEDRGKISFSSHPIISWVHKIHYDIIFVMFLHYEVILSPTFYIVQRRHYIQATLKNGSYAYGA